MQSKLMFDFVMFIFYPYFSLTKKQLKKLKNLIVQI
jgi:hypothetical protein